MLWLGGGSPGTYSIIHNNQFNGVIITLAPSPSPANSICLTLYLHLPYSLYLSRALSLSISLFTSLPLSLSLSISPPPGTKTLRIEVIMRSSVSGAYSPLLFVILCGSRGECRLFAEGVV